MEPIKKVPFTKEMKKTHTILIPTMLPIHFRILGNVLENYGYKVKVLDNCGPGVIEQGLKNVHNDTCYPGAAGHRPDDRRAGAAATYDAGQGGAADYPDRRRLPRFQLHLSAAQGAQQVRATATSRSSPLNFYGAGAVRRLLAAGDDAAAGCCTACCAAI